MSMSIQNAQITSASANISVRCGLSCQLAGMSSPQSHLTVRLLDGIVRPVAPLGPVWGAMVRPDELRALADFVSRSLETSRLREQLAHWIVEREAERKEEAKTAEARRAERQEKERQKRGATKKRERAPHTTGRPNNEPWKIAMPPADASAAVVYAAFSRAAGSNSARRAAYRFGRQSVCAAERAVDELVDREYLRLRAGDHAHLVSRGESRLALRDGEKLDTLEKIHVVMSVRRAIVNAPGERLGTTDEDSSNPYMSLVTVDEIDDHDCCDEYYWTPDEPELEPTVFLPVAASAALASLATLADYFDPLRVGKTLVSVKALPAFMDSVAAIVLGRGKQGNRSRGILGKPDRPWYEGMYSFARPIAVVGGPDPAKQGTRVLRDGEPPEAKRGRGRSTHRPGDDAEAFRRKLSLGMLDLADERHSKPTPGDHRLIDRLREDERPVLWSAKRLRERREERARGMIRHVIDEFESKPFSVGDIAWQSSQCRSRVEDVIEELLLEGRLRRLERAD